MGAQHASFAKFGGRKSCLASSVSIGTLEPRDTAMRQVIVRLDPFRSASRSRLVYVSDLSAWTRGEAHARVSAAQSRKEQGIAVVTGDTKRFLMLLKE